MKKKIIYTVLILILIFLFGLGFINSSKISYNVFKIFKYGVDYFESNGHYKLAEYLLKQNFFIQNYFYKNENFKSASMMDLAGFYNEQGLYTESEKLYKQFISQKEKNKELISASIYSRLGYTKLKQRDYKEAENYYKKAIKTKDIACAKYPRKAQEDWDLVLDYNSDLNQIALIEMKENKYKEAKYYLDKSTSLVKNSNLYNKYNKFIIIDNYIYWAKYYQSIRNSKEFKKYVNLIIHLSKEEKEKNFTLSNDKIEYRELSLLYKGWRNYNEAIKLLEKSRSIETKIIKEKVNMTVCDYYNLGQLYKLTQNEDKYKEMYNNSFFIGQKILGLKNLNSKNYNQKFEWYCN